MVEGVEIGRARGGSGGLLFRNPWLPVAVTTAEMTAEVENWYEFGGLGFCLLDSEKKLGILMTPQKMRRREKIG